MSSSAWTWYSEPHAMTVHIRNIPPPDTCDVCHEAPCFPMPLQLIYLDERFGFICSYFCARYWRRWVKEGTIICRTWSN
jgi:hypothetical protein